MVSNPAGYREVYPDGTGSDLIFRTAFRQRFRVSGPGGQLHFADGIKWVRNAVPASYDVIIVDSTDPVGPAESLFAAPFLQDCLQALSETGLLVQQSESPLFHLQSLLKPLRHSLRQAGFVAVHTLHFPQRIYPSGWWTVTLATTTGDPIRFRAQDAVAKPFATDDYNVESHCASLATPEFMRRALMDSGR